MRDWQSLSHVKWECKYHIVWVPKYRRKVLFGKVRRRAGEIIRELCRQRELEIIEGHSMPDHIHACISIPPKYSVANAIGFLKGKSAIRLHREFGELGMGKHFWIRGYNVSTVGLNEEQIRKYIREQEYLDKRQMELDLR
jgi:putative transposase